MCQLPELNALRTQVEERKREQSFARCKLIAAASHECKVKLNLHRHSLSRRIMQYAFERGDLNTGEAAIARGELVVQVPLILETSPVLTMTYWRNC